MSKWQWIIRQLTGRLWLRASIFCIIGVLSALLGVLVKGHVPIELSEKVGAEAVDDILNILASSMLAVTTFSLSIMVSAYSAAASGATPRSTKLLLADHTSQNALSTFIGTFLFSLVGIIALKMDAYAAGGRLLLFLATIAIILFVILTLLRWIEYLSRLGRVGQTIDMVERAARDSLERHAKWPYLGGSELKDFIPTENHIPIRHETIGYIQHIDVDKLSRIAEETKTPVYVMQRPGSFNDSHRPIAYIAHDVDEDLTARIQNAFTIGDERSFEQDPRYGLVVLAEIASRALSPAVNDQGTAIDVIGTVVRLLAPMAKNEIEAKDIDYQNVFIPAIETEDFFEDAYVPIARDGAGMIEIGQRLQKSYKSLYNMSDNGFKEAAKAYADQSLQRSLKTLKLEQEKDILKQLCIAC